MRPTYFALGLVALVVGVFARWLATDPVPWWLLVVLVLSALGGFGHGLFFVLTRRSRRRPTRVVDALGRPPRVWLGLAAALALCGWLLLMAGFAVAGGQPSNDGAGTCQYYRSDRGDRACITRDEYNIATAHAQSMGFAAAAFFLGFATSSAGGLRRP